MKFPRLLQLDVLSLLARWTLIFLSAWVLLLPAHAQTVAPGAVAATPHDPSKSMLPDARGAVPWSLLSAATIKMSKGKLGPAFPEALRPLDGKTVKLRGYILPIEAGQTHRYFLLSAWFELTEIPAPPFKEAVRAQEYQKRLKALGLADARIDAEGNVIAVRKGSGNGPVLVVSAHLDTVFPEGTDVKVKIKGNRYEAPGIYDDGRGLASLLSVLRALNHTGMKTIGDIVFVGTVGEEELGDLRGVKALFRDNKAIDGFISLDGLDIGRIVNQATGSRRFRIIYTGPGGHSFSAFGLPSATHALGRAIAKISEVRTIDEPKTTYTVGTLKGGTSVNAIAADAELGLDMRSNSAAELKKLEDRIMALAREAADEENKRWDKKDVIKVEFKLVGDRPAGAGQVDSPMVSAARRAVAAVGGEVKSIAASSTDSNLPISLGIPAVTLGSGGVGGGSHGPGEWYSPINAWLGPQSTLLTVLSLVGVDGVTQPLLPKRAP